MPRSNLLKSVAFSAIMLAAIPAKADDPTFTDLGTLGVMFSYANGISADGTAITGESLNSSHEWHAYRWENGVMTDLGTLGGTSSSANTISADGNVIVGYSYTAGGDRHAFRWENGVMADLGTLGGATSTAIVLSTDGTIVAGAADIANGDRHAFRWENGVMTDLGTLGGTDSFADSMSANGAVIAGRSYIAGGQLRAFRWENGVMTDLGTLGGATSTANALSTDGAIVVGAADTAGGQNHAFRWENGVMTDLGTLGGTSSTASALSMDGEVVIGAARTAGGHNHAFRWENGVMADLGTLGGDASDAYDLSADGKIIVGYSENGSGDERLFRWTQEDGLQSLEDILIDAGVDLTGWELDGTAMLNQDGSVIAGTSKYNGLSRAFIMTMAGITTPQEFTAALTPAIGMPSQAMEAMTVSTSQSMTASREAFGSFTSGAFRLSANTLNSSNPSDLNDVATASGPLSAPLYQDSRLAGYIIGSTAFAHDHAAGDHNASGTIGMFYRISDEVAIGAGVTGGHNKRELRLGGESRVASYGGNLNIAYEGGEGFRIYGTAGASTLNVQMDRNYLNGAGIDTSKGETDGLSYGAALQAGYEMPVTDSISIMPYAAIEASRTKIDGYAETGGAFAATFDDRATSLVTSRLGAELSFDTGEDMEIRARAAWGHVLSENGDDLSATVINLPQTIAYQEGRKDWIEGGVTFSWQYADTTRLVADIAGRSGKDTDTAASATLGLTFGF